ncbi:MAG: hypothetical protein ACPG32_09570 [Akkermansiaceae bacterium]
MKSTREFIYPIAYRAAQVDSLQSVTPVTPTAFAKKEIGYVANITATRRGHYIVLQGEIIYTTFLGFTKITDDFARPIVDAKGNTITANTVEMPRFASYTSAVFIVLKPGQNGYMEMSHQKKARARWLVKAAN